MTATGILERDFDRQVADLFRAHGWSTAHFHDSRRQVRPGVFVGDKEAAGWPDRVFVRPPEFIVVELKRDKGRLSVLQSTWLRLLDECGIETHVWRPQDWDAIVRRAR